MFTEDQLKELTPGALALCIQSREARVALYDALKDIERFVSAYEESRFFMEECEAPYLDWKTQIELVRDRAGQDIVEMLKAFPKLKHYLQLGHIIEQATEDQKGFEMSLLTAYAIDTYKHGEDIREDLEQLRGMQNE
ncbi:hypothetical protein KY346_04860 [Candidatus Woesearchaeota archaeon]|nr:hypothetical protein [Candidatus Woesearchaeota archaeon]